jgi:hypothetical protein
MVETTLNTPWQSSGRTWLGALGALAVFGSLGWSVGPIGFLAGAIIAVLWFLLPGAYAVALGHVVALPVITDPTLGLLLVLEAGFVGIVAGPIVQDREWPIGLGAVGGAALVLGAIAWLGWRTWEPRWLVGIAVVGLVAVGLYGLHRYSVVVLELQEVEHAA